MDRCFRRRGQFLVVVGALLGALVGVVLGLAVEDAQTSTAIAAPGRARAALAATPPSRQPTADQTAASGDQADGDASTGSQRIQSAYRLDWGHGKAHKDRRGIREGDWKETGNRGHGKPGNDKAGKGKRQVG